MRYALFSDVHGNLEALKAVLKDFSRQSIDRLLFLGDVVGYYPDPNKCVKLIQKIADVYIMGNHDYAAMGLVNLELFNANAKEAMEWTQTQLRTKYMDFISTFFMRYERERFMLVHGNPKDPEGWGYILTPQEAEDNFRYFNRQICFIAHSHRPVFIRKRGEEPVEFIDEAKLELEDTVKYIINIGSVGQPRDRNPDACYLIYDTKTKTVALRRVAYPVEKTQKKIIKAGLPVYLAERLAEGR